METIWKTLEVNQDVIQTTEEFDGISVVHGRVCEIYSNHIIVESDGMHLWIDDNTKDDLKLVRRNFMYKYKLIKTETTHGKGKFISHSQIIGASADKKRIDAMFADILRTVLKEHVAKKNVYTINQVPADEFDPHKNEISFFIHVEFINNDEGTTWHQYEIVTEQEKCVPAVFGDYVLSPCQNAFNDHTSYWLSKKDMTVSMYCFSDDSLGMGMSYEEQVKNINSYIKLFKEKYEEGSV